MTEQLIPRHDADELEYIESEEELLEYLETIAPYIGWIVIYFNSLEDSLTDFIREAILRDSFNDERLDGLLSEMMFAGKCKALMNLYGQLTKYDSVKYTQKDVSDLEKSLIECAKRRNEYAHADWIGLKKESYARVKVISKKDGVLHRYRRFEISRMEEDVNFISKARHALDEFNRKIYDQVYGREE